MPLRNDRGRRKPPRRFSMHTPRNGKSVNRRTMLNHPVIARSVATWQSASPVPCCKENGFPRRHCVPPRNDRCRRKPQHRFRNSRKHSSLFTTFLTPNHRFALNLCLSLRGAQRRGNPLPPSPAAKRADSHVGTACLLGMTGVGGSLRTKKHSHHCLHGK